MDIRVNGFRGEYLALAVKGKGCLIGAILLALWLAGCGSRPAQLPQQELYARVDPMYYDAVVVAAVTPTPLVPVDADLSDAELISLGEMIYVTNCAPCHHLNGEGNLETFPALNRNAFVTLIVPEPVIDTVVNGREIMPAFAPTLHDGEIAAVVSYIRNAWSNDASVVSPNQVEEAREGGSEE
jgi:mono/diheme cytochrome c family protein